MGPLIGHPLTFGQHRPHAGKGINLFPRRAQRVLKPIWQRQDPVAPTHTVGANRAALAVATRSAIRPISSAVDALGTAVAALYVKRIYAVATMPTTWLTDASKLFVTLGGDRQNPTTQKISNRAEPSQNKYFPKKRFYISEPQIFYQCRSYLGCTSLFLHVYPQKLRDTLSLQQIKAVWMVGLIKKELTSRRNATAWQEPAFDKVPPKLTVERVQNLMLRDAVNCEAASHKSRSLMTNNFKQQQKARAIG